MPADGKTTYRWVIGLLMAVLMFAGGTFIGQQSVAQDLKDHAKRSGHPVIVERVDLHYREIQRALDDVKANQRAILEELRALGAQR